MPTREETIHASLNRLSSPSFLNVTNPALRARLNDVNDTIRQVKKEFGTLEAKKKNGELGPEDEADYDRYADKLADGLPKIENGVIDVASAFESGDPLAEAESVLGLCGSLVSTIGAMAGPEGALAGGLLSALFGMISAILKLFGPPPIPLIDQIKTLLLQEEAKAQYQQLRVALLSFQSLEDAWQEGLWPVINLQNGPEVQQLRAADEWLIEPDNQKDAIWDKWGKVLDMQCKVFIAAVKAVPLALHALNQQTGMTPYEKQNAGGLLTVGIRTLAQNQLAFLEGVASVVQKRGIYAIVGGNSDFYFSGDQFVTANPIENGNNLTIAATTDEITKPDPNLHVFALIDNYIWHGTLQWPSGPMIGWSKLSDTTRALDICAIADDKGGILYWLLFPGLMSCVSLDTGKIISQVNLEDYSVQSMDAVFGPKSIGDDPDENSSNPRVLDGVTQAAYLGINNSKSIFVHVEGSAGVKDDLISVPRDMDNYYGISVDKRFLWVFGEQNIYRASHTSVLRSLGRTPRWASVIPDGNNFLSGAMCEDHSLFQRDTRDNTLSFSSYDAKYWANDGLFGLGQNVGTTAIRMMKLPSYRWFLMGGLIESLRVQAKKPMKSTTKLAASA